MPTPEELAAYIGAAAWLPQIGSWLYPRLVPPVVRIIPERQLQLGFTTYGPIFNIRMSLGADRRDAVIEHMEVRLQHEQGDVHCLSWIGLRETFSEISDSQGNRQLVERDQPAIALKVSTILLLEKFVRFQDPAYHDRHRVPVDAAVAHQSYLRTLSPDRAESGKSLLDSREFHNLMAFYRAEFWWKPGRYTASFSIKSSNRAKLDCQSFVFRLAQHDVESLRSNIELMETDYRNLVLGGTPGFEAIPVVWNWRTISFTPIPPAG
jgi:hypothetical protein